MTETRDIKLRRLHMRSIRRGIKEMDLIFTDFATSKMPDLSDADLELYDALLQENDQDIYGWITGQGEAPEQYAPIWGDILAGAQALTQPK